MPNRRRWYHAPKPITAQINDLHRLPTMASADNASALSREVVPLLKRIMDDEWMGLLTLPGQTGVPKSRLGVLLYRDFSEAGHIAIFEL